MWNSLYKDSYRKRRGGLLCRDPNGEGSAKACRITQNMMLFQANNTIENLSFVSKVTVLYYKFPPYFP